MEAWHFSKIFEEIGRIHIQPVNRTLWMHHGSVSRIIEKSIMQLPTIVEANTYTYRMLQTQLIVFATSRCSVFLWFHVFFNDEMVDGWLEVTSTHHLDQMAPEEWGIRGSTELPQWFKSFPWFKVVFGNGGCLEVSFGGGYVSGQSIATSHDLTPKGSWEREIPLFQGNLGWWNIIIWPDI